MIGTHFEIYPSPRFGLGAANALAPTEWRWRLRAANGEPLAQGESYRDKRDCERVVELLKQTHAFTPVQYLS